MNRSDDDLRRELEKIADPLDLVVKHFRAEAEMNAALHMAATVRPAPLALAIEAARDDVYRLIAELTDDLSHPTPARSTPHALDFAVDHSILDTEDGNLRMEFGAWNALVREIVRAAAPQPRDDLRADSLDALPSDFRLFGLTVAELRTAVAVADFHYPTWRKDNAGNHEAALRAEGSSKPPVGLGLPSSEGLGLTASDVREGSET